MRSVNSLALLFLVFAALGSGMMAGLFCSFSGFIMQALGEISPDRGIAAMQSINRVIVKPAFLMVFLGTGVASILALAMGWQQFDPASLAWIAAGGTIYIVGSIVVTMAFNVPLNNRLAAVDPGHGDGTQMWETYLQKWTRWNHVRSVATIASTLCLIIAVLHA